MRSLDICLSPDLIHLYDLNGKTAVVVDILRATSCITTAIAHGVDHLVPFASLDECRLQREKGYVIAGERGGQQVPGFDLGNSPFGYMSNELRGAKIAITTTNGTLALKKAEKANRILIGSFLNLTQTIRLLQNDDSDVIVICAGWKGRVNLEDTLYAGAVAGHLGASHDFNDDAVLAAQSLFERHQEELLPFVEASSHAKRLAKFNVIRDIEFCLNINTYEVQPVYVNGRITNEPLVGSTE